MTIMSGSDRVRIAVEAGAEITKALADADAPTVIARRVAEALDVWECDLHEYDPVSRTLTGTAIWSRQPTSDDESWIGTRVSLDERPGYAPIIEGGRCVVSRLSDPDLDPADREAMEEWGEVEALAVPLRFSNRGVVGCLVLVEKREDRPFTDEDVELVTLLAGPAAVAVRNARLFRLQQEQNRYLGSLLATGRTITRSITLEDSLARICRTAAEALQTQECIVYEHDAARDAIICRAFYSSNEAAPLIEDTGVYPLEDYPSDREILGRGMVVQETLADEGLPDDVRASMERWGEKACLNVPLIVEGEALGILVLMETERERIFDAGEVELARALGEQAATAIRHARLYRRGERQNRRLTALLESSRVLASSLDVDAVLGEVRREVVGLFDVPGDAVDLLLRRGESFVPFRSGPLRVTRNPLWPSSTSCAAGRSTPCPRRWTARASSYRSSPATPRTVCSSSAPAPTWATTSSSCCRSSPARPRSPSPTRPSTARSSARPSPTGSPASTTIATSTSASTRRSRAPRGMGCRSPC